MLQVKNPNWIPNELQKYCKFEDIPLDVFDQINRRLSQFDCDKPLVSVLIAAWNEEDTILSAIDTLSKQKTTYPFEIIVINNNSTDKTQKILDKLNIISLFQSVQGVGPAKQMGMENAKGKYILSADADCFYPPKWLDSLVISLNKKNVVAVYGRCSFLGDEKIPRWKWAFYEIPRNFLMWARHFKRPFLNAFGMSMGFVKEYGLKEGFVQRKVRGFDGRMIFDLMKYGKIARVNKKEAVVWTGYRVFDREGGILNAIVNKIAKEIIFIKNYFTKLKDHDTKASKNPPQDLKGLLKRKNNKKAQDLK